MNKILKLSLLIFFLFGIINQNSFADSIVGQKLTIKVKDVEFIEVLKEIRAQSGYNFIYNEKFVETLDKVTLNIENVSLDYALEASLKGTRLTYEIQNGIIILLPKVAQIQQEQSIRVVGVVKDKAGVPIPGVTVLLKGLNAGVGTDIDGKFTVDVPSSVKVLTFSFIGMESKDVVIPKDGKPMIVVLEEKIGELDEVVITGYTQTTKRNATGSVAVVGEQVFKNKPIPNVDQLLQGQVAGLVVTKTSGRPGTSAKVRIRGTNTITGNASPLWVVDGVALQKNIPSISTGQIRSGDFTSIFTDGIAGINPNDIKSVTVLKDASATAIYGSRAAGGVIVVTTKQGEAGKIKVSYAMTLSMDLLPQRDKGLMNSKEKLAWEQELWDDFSKDSYENNQYFPVIGITGMVRGGLEQFAGMTTEEQDSYLEELSQTSTNWVDELFRESISHNHYLSVSGGTDKATYYVSGGFSSNKGLIKRTDYTRYNLSGKLNLTPNGRLRIGIGADLSNQRANGSSMGVDAMSYAYFANPYEKPYNEDGSYSSDNTYFSLKRINGGTDIALAPNGFNIFREINETSSRADNLSTSVRFNLDYNITNELKFSGLLNYSYTNNKTKNINGKDTYTAFQDRPFDDLVTSKRTYGSITQTSANNNSYSLRGQFSYAKNLTEKHRISLLAGSEIRGQKAESLFAKRYGYDPVTGNSSIPIYQKPTSTDQIDYNELKSYAAIVDGLSGQSVSEDRYASFYGSVDYFYDRKYVASFSFRTDGSNKFGSDEQFNPTWSLGLAWHMMEEPFMEKLSSIFDDLSLRVATGYTGNINTSVYPQLIMSYSNSFRKTDDETYRMGSISSAPNPKLRWEKTQDYKVAVGFSIFDSKLSGSVEGYYRLSKDVVTNVTVPYTTGYSTQGYNTSELENEGIEVTLNTKILTTEDIKLSASVNFAWNKNNLKSYNSPTGVNYSGNIVGYPLASIFSGKTLGIDPSTGIYRFKLRPDSEIYDERDLSKAENYMFYLGTSTAPYTGGFNVSFSYKRFGLNVGGTYSMGAHILDDVNSPANYSSVMENSSVSGIDREAIPTKYNDLYVSHLNVRKELTNRWTSDNTTDVKYPRIINTYGEKLNLDLINPTYSGVTNGAFLENVSFLRISNISFSYSFPNSVLDKVGISSLSTSLTLNNFFTFTNYSGIDPETPGATYPLTRSLSFAINVGF